jgi:hypothetical protein
MAQVLVDPQRGTTHDIVPNAQSTFEVAPPLKWVTLPSGLAGKRTKYNPQADKVEEVPPKPRPPVVIDPTPDTLDVIQFLIDEGIVSRAKVNSARPDWVKLLDNNAPGQPRRRSEQ